MKKTLLANILFLSVSILLGVKNVSAETPTSTFSKKQPIGWSQRVFATPDSPASQLIGSTASTIPNISTPGAFATSLLNGLNSDGKFSTTIGFDTVPYLLFRGSGITLEEYQNQGLSRFLANTTISVATISATIISAPTIAVTTNSTATISATTISAATISATTNSTATTSATTISLNEWLTIYNIMACVV